MFQLGNPGNTDKAKAEQSGSAIVCFPCTKGRLFILMAICIFSNNIASQVLFGTTIWLPCFKISPEGLSSIYIETNLFFNVTLNLEAGLSYLSSLA